MEENKPLKYLGYAIVCAEVPDEISLAFNISGCEHQCEDCHSKYLWDYDGEYISEDLEETIVKYKGLISCVCFMGGDQNINELAALCSIVKEYGMKTCIYSGNDSIDVFRKLITNNLIDYLKIGRYDSSCGGLNKPTTNQRMYKITNNNLEDITSRFWRKP